MHDRRHLDRRHHTLTACLVLLLSLVGLPAAGAAESPGPVLWDGVLRTPDGRPTEGEVVAFVRPPADRLEPGHQLTEVARVETDSSGRFVLRSRPSPAFQSARDESGWVGVMVFAFTRDGVALAVDAVAWRPDEAIHAQSADADRPGRWITDPADLTAPASRFHAAESRPTPETERPAALVVGARPASPAVKALEARGKPPAGTTCGLERSKDMGIHEVAVGELHLRDAWGGFFEYTNTKSTSFQTGVSYGGRGWQVGGSDSMTATSSMNQKKTISPAERQDADLISYRAELLFKRFDWRCSKSGLQWEDISTLQPVSWPNGGMRERLGGEPPRCGSDSRYFGSVMPNASVSRKKGASITLERAISVAGFAGAMTSAVASGVHFQWHNDRPFHRQICGSSDVVDGNTRVATSGFRG